MVTIPNVLAVVAVVFLVADALGKLPSWTWGLCLLLLVLMGGR
jgi:hypothetical protein